MTNTSLLEVKNLSTTFTVLKQDLPAVRGVDFHVNEGEILGIVGESGSGKSVTMKSVIPSCQKRPVEAEGCLQGMTC